MQQSLAIRNKAKKKNSTDKRLTYKVKSGVYVEEYNFMQVHKFVALLEFVTKSINSKQSSYPKFVVNRYHRNFVKLLN